MRYFMYINIILSATLFVGCTREYKHYTYDEREKLGRSVYKKYIRIIRPDYIFQDEELSILPKGEQLTNYVEVLNKNKNEMIGMYDEYVLQYRDTLYVSESIAQMGMPSRNIIKLSEDKLTSIADEIVKRFENASKYQRIKSKMDKNIENDKGLPTFIVEYHMFDYDIEFRDRIIELRIEPSHGNLVGFNWVNYPIHPINDIIYDKLKIGNLGLQYGKSYLLSRKNIKLNSIKPLILWLQAESPYLKNVILYDRFNVYYRTVYKANVDRSEDGVNWKNSDILLIVNINARSGRLNDNVECVWEYRKELENDIDILR